MNGFISRDHSNTIDKFSEELKREILEKERKHFTPLTGLGKQILKHWKDFRNRKWIINYY